MALTVGLSTLTTLLSLLRITVFAQWHPNLKFIAWITSWSWQTWAVLWSVVWIFVILQGAVAVVRKREAKIGGQDRHRVALEENIKQLSAELEKREIARRELEVKLKTQLKQDSAEPTPQEERQRQHVRAELRNQSFTADERNVLRYILDHSRVRKSTLVKRLSGYAEQVIPSTVRKAKETDLVFEEIEQLTGERWLSVNPELKCALDFVLNEQTV